MSEEEEHEISIHFLSSKRMAEAVKRVLLKSIFIRDLGFDDDQIRLDGIRPPHMRDETKLAILKHVMELLDDPSVEVEMNNKIGADWGHGSKPCVCSSGTRITIETFTVRVLEEGT